MTASRPGRSAGIVALTVVGLLTGQKPADAHDKTVHQDMVDFAYQTLRLVDHDAASRPAYLRPPPGVAPADWQRYLDSIVASVARLDLLPTALPAPRAPSCRPDEGSTAPPPGWNEHTLLGSVPYEVSSDYLSGSSCGLRGSWHPGGLFNALQTSTRHNGGGLVLGLWAASIDDREDDTHLWVRPSSMLGLGAAKAEASKWIKDGLTVLAVPLICAWKCIFGGCSTCMGAARDFADSANPVDAIDGWMPGFGDVSGGSYNTMWHFLNVQAGRSNEYDDVQGLLYEQAGWHGEPDPVDVAIMLWFDASGLSFHYDRSDGIHHYQITDARDGHPDTDLRSEATWQFTTAAHTPVEPLDNLAFYGWRNFRDAGDHSVQWLGFPLHALGDAVAPHHTIGSSGWGHRPYELSVARQWWELRSLTGPSDDGTQNLDVQLAQLQRILAAGYQWRQDILAWRAADPARGNDVPVRDLITQLARNTLAYAETDGGWPFLRGASLLEQAASQAATTLYLGPASVIHQRTTIESGVGAMVAFLVSATEVL